MWKFDLTDPDAANWEVAFNDGLNPQPLIKVQGPGGASATAQPITTKPDVAFHPVEQGYMVFFGTGKYLGQKDLEETTQQTIYGIWDYGDDDDDSEYLGVFQRENMFKLSNQPSTVGLLQQDYIENPADPLVDPGAPYFFTVDGDLWRLITNYSITWKTVNDPDGGAQNPDLSNAEANHAGWYFDLPVAGERVEDDVGLVLGRLWVMSIIPEADPCGYGGESIFHELDYETGGRLDDEVFDIDDDFIFDENDRINNIPPSGLMINGNASMPAGAGGGGGTIQKHFTTTAGGVRTVTNRGVLLGISHWRELD
jgi:type IV pilus assembly protein PilY1